ncbi:MAG TPA: DUF799 family lipoprotein [Nitrospira sp.]|nr:DUF799 family lipoprotein [Nitrospira sp.]
MFRKSDRFIAHHLQACGIPLIYKALSSLVLVLQLVGCKATYDLSVYEQSLLALGGPDGVNQSAALLDQSIVSAEMVSATIPPGVYADHGILLHLAGNETEAMRQINKESELYPESQQFTDNLLRVIRNTGLQPSGDSSSLHRRPSVLVLPPINKSGKPEAGLAFEMTLNRQFIEHGYYVFPTIATQALVAGSRAIPADMSVAGPSSLHKLTGADAILSVTITEWEPTWMIIPLIRVAAEYTLVDIATGQDIWKSTARDEFDPTVTGGGGPVIVMDKDLRIPARKLTAKALKSSENGLPYGPYH